MNTNEIKVERAILVAADIDRTLPLDYRLKELQNLAEACNIEVVFTITQALQRVNVHSYIGKGKVEEVKEAVALYDADLVIFNDELGPTQIKNLEEQIESKIIDKTMLILDIFARRARTKEAMIQVEMAQLKYMLPRVYSLAASLSRQQGAGIGSRGDGEKKYELDKRKIQDQIVHLSKELQEVVKVRQTQRKKRKKNDLKSVCLVGYTNSGKSTLLNSLLVDTSEDKQVFAKDMLFATLETSTRLVKLENNLQFAITDTVGFVSDLPHHLVNSFKSTLEEIKEADVIVHVVDLKSDQYLNNITVTNEVLEDMGVQDIPMIYAYNKIDVKQDFEKPFEGVEISAKNNTNLDTLLQLIQDTIFEVEEVTLLLPFDKGDIFSYLSDNTNVTDVEYLNEGTKFKALLNQEQSNKYQEYIIK